MSELRADTITASNGTSPVTLTKQNAAKMWVSYDPRGNIFYGSFNASAITDNGTGQHQITISSSFSSGNTVAFSAIAGDVQSSNRHMPQAGLCRDGSNPYGASFVEIQTNFDDQVTTLTDMDFVHVTGHGDLA